MLDNALIHTPVREKVYISLGREQGYGVLEVSDGGSGISFQELQRTLEQGRDSGSVLSGGLSVSRRYVSALMVFRCNFYLTQVWIKDMIVVRKQGYKDIFIESLYPVCTLSLVSLYGFLLQ